MIRFTSRPGRKLFGHFGVSVLDSPARTVLTSDDGAVDLLARWPAPSRPFVTYYDLASGERTELSGTTTANWVAKAANLLLDDGDAEPGTRIGLTLPTHWMRVVCTLAAWRVGATIVDTGADICICGPDLVGTAPIRLASALHPLGLPFTDLADGVLDLGQHLAGQPDQFAPFDVPSPEQSAIDLDGLSATYAELENVGEPTDDRLAFGSADLTDDVRRLVAACLGGGSLVLVAHASEDEMRHTAAQEHARIG